MYVHQEGQLYILLQLQYHLKILCVRNWYRPKDQSLHRHRNMVWVRILQVRMVQSEWAQVQMGVGRGLEEEGGLDRTLWLGIYL